MCQQACIQIFTDMLEHILCQPHTDSGAEGSAPSHRSPWGPDGLTACLIVKNAGDAIQFYKKAFGAKELLRIEAPWGTPNYELEHRG